MLHSFVFLYVVHNIKSVGIPALLQYMNEGIKIFWNLHKSKNMAGIQYLYLDAIAGSFWITCKEVLNDVNFF